MRREQSSVICEGTSVSCRYGRQKVDPGGIEPAQHLIDRMPCFVGVSILVAKPRLPAALVHPSRVQTAGQERQCRTKPFEGPATPQGRQASIAIIKPDQDVAAGFHFTKQGLEAFAGIPGVVEHAIADKDVDAVVPEGWSKKIHLQKGCVGNSVALTETVRQSQRVKADVAAQNPSLPRQTKE